MTEAGSPSVHFKQAWALEGQKGTLLFVFKPDPGQIASLLIDSKMKLRESQAMGPSWDMPTHSKVINGS